MTKSADSLDFNRLSVLSGAILLALVLTRFLQTPPRPLLQTKVFGSPLDIGLSAGNLLPLIILGLTITGMGTLIQSHPTIQVTDVEQWYMAWIVPGMLNMALARWLSRIDDTAGWVIALLACAVLVPAALVVEFRSVTSESGQAQSIQWRHMMFVHLTAVVFFTLIYDARSRSLLSAMSIALVSLLMATRFFWGSAPSLARALLYGSVVGLVLGQLTWGLNYLPLSGMQGGLSLLVAFYVLTGLIRRFLQGQLADGQDGHRTLIEYGAVAIVTLLLIIYAAP